MDTPAGRARIGNIMKSKKENEKKAKEPYQKPAIRVERKVDAFASTCFQANYKVALGNPDGFAGVCVTLFS